LRLTHEAIETVEGFTAYYGLAPGEYSETTVDLPLQAPDENGVYTYWINVPHDSYVTVYVAVTAYDDTRESIKSVERDRLAIRTPGAPYVVFP